VVLHLTAVSFTLLGGLRERCCSDFEAGNSSKTKKNNDTSDLWIRLNVTKNDCVSRAWGSPLAPTIQAAAAAKCCAFKIFFPAAVFPAAGICFSCLLPLQAR
jgi:hypothetical protein